MPEPKVLNNGIILNVEIGHTGVKRVIIKAASPENEKLLNKLLSQIQAVLEGKGEPKVNEQRAVKP